MINRQALLADLQKFLQRIEADLLERSESTEVPEVPAALHAEYEKAAKAERTAQNYEDWRTDTITQAAAAWVLSCVFVRFLEDNSLIDPPKIAGPGDRLARARDEHELYFRSHPQHTDREYLLSIFAELAKLPGTRGIFGEHNAINDLPNWLSGDTAGELLNFFQKIDASTGELVHDFTDPNWDTRFLGDLYQDLSEAARKKFALLQTPDFVEEFILDRTLEPALDEFGLEQDLGFSNHGKLPGFDDRNTLRIPFKMIDPACGSGHFLLGAFPRLLDRWQRKEPGTNIRELTQRALDSIHGVDINPFAVGIAKFRLLLKAMKACDIKHLANAPAFRIHVACGDSLLHGENRTSSGQRLWDYAEGATDEELYSHAYPGEDLQSVRSLLKPGSYQCVVANPPYIVPNDRKLSDWYRKRYSACHMTYSLSIPFFQQIFQLSVAGGFTGQITANSFMKRDFGKKLIESCIPQIELSHVIDLSGAYIPGHGTPTVILVGRNRSQVSTTVRTVQGKRGEPRSPEKPSAGLVWTSITNFMDSPGSENEFISVLDEDKHKFYRHPWTLQGGGASSVKAFLDNSHSKRLGEFVRNSGRTNSPGIDDCYLIDQDSAHRNHINEHCKPIVVGDCVRDWRFLDLPWAIYPYEKLAGDPVEYDALVVSRYLWHFRTLLSSRSVYGKSLSQNGKAWFEHLEHYRDKLGSPFCLCWVEIATHNHFVVSVEPQLHKQTAPLLNLLAEYSISDCQSLAGVLNSSTVCFWIKQVSHNKGDATDQLGARTTGDPAFDTYDFKFTKLAELPVPHRLPTESSLAICEFAEKLSALSPKVILKSIWSKQDTPFNASPNLREIVTQTRFDQASIFQEMISAQEDLDWECYILYGLCQGAIEDKATLPPTTLRTPVRFGQRAFEIVLARRMASGETQSTWFERHGSKPITDLPADWPEEYKQLVERRIEMIEKDPNIRLIEQPEYKRRWNTEPWESQLERALREWLLFRLETYVDFDGRMTDASVSISSSVSLGEIALYSISQLADTARRDLQFMEVGELYRDDPAFDVQALVEELVLAESVPHLPILRYKDSGLRKRAEWEKTWDFQRREDAGESVGTIPVPPKYTSADFISTGGARYWSLRGKLDVPKERWISFPHCEGPDGTLVICWAGYDHLQQAQAISAYYVRVQTEFGGSDDPRLIPLLASLIELLPWLKQWHNEPNANFDGLRMGDYFDGFVNEEARNLGKTLAEIKAWVPVKGQSGRGAKGQSGKKVAKAKRGKGSKVQSDEGADE